VGFLLPDQVFLWSVAAVDICGGMVFDSGEVLVDEGGKMSVAIAVNMVEMLDGDLGNVGLSAGDLVNDSIVLMVKVS